MSEIKATYAYVTSQIKLYKKYNVDLYLENILFEILIVIYLPK